MHTEDDLLPISALQHMLFCERQTALIHLERLWVENPFTAEGRLLHKKTDNAKSETRDGIRITRSLPVHSFKLGIFGVCDVVNFQPPDIKPATALSLPKRIEAELARIPSFNPRPTGQDVPTQSLPPFHLWTITPVEYKRGKPKTNNCDRVQLCAQTMCLEEMLGVTIQRGDLFYGQQQRRTEVIMDDELRQITQLTAERLHALIREQRTPFAVREKKCETCSMLSVCIPPASSTKSASRYLNSITKE
ncbi:MAG: CRISPR-associated protein Cas4 [Planctomycetaceae bacterium]